jgi:hypothetical protein
MSLDWNVGEVEDFENRCFVEEIRQGEKGRYLRPKSEALIWLTINVGLPSITEENAEEFAIRARIWERAMGALCRKFEKDENGKTEILDDPVEYEDVIRHVGLYTNASRFTQKQFHEHLIGALRRDSEWITRLHKERYHESESE